MPGYIVRSYNRFQHCDFSLSNTIIELHEQVNETLSVIMLEVYSRVRHLRMTVH